jgi:hypothetical protein
VFAFQEKIMRNIVIALGFVASFLPLACSGSDTSGTKSTSTTSQTLSVVGACVFSGCGSLPSNLSSAPSVTCSGASADACAWSADSGDDSAVSYRWCTASECPPAPAIDCPTGTVRSTQQCGSENDAACTWTTVCTPPRSTTPCADQNGCGVELERGVVCSDGTSGALVCVTDGSQCSWQPNCD